MCLDFSDLYEFMVEIAKCSADSYSRTFKERICRKPKIKIKQAVIEFIRRLHRVQHRRKGYNKSRQLLASD